jgi:hypothetical protein
VTDFGCRTCGATLPEGTRYCTECGAATDPAGDPAPVHGPWLTEKLTATATATAPAAEPATAGAAPNAGRGAFPSDVALLVVAVVLAGVALWLVARDDAVAGLVTAAVAIVAFLAANLLAPGGRAGGEPADEGVGSGRMGGLRAGATLVTQRTRQAAALSGLRGRLAAARRERDRALFALGAAVWAERDAAPERQAVARAEAAVAEVEREIAEVRDHAQERIDAARRRRGHG